MAHAAPLDPRLPTRVTLAAVALAACILLPFGRDGDASLLRLLIEAWHDDWLGGTLIALVFGAPHGFAAALVLASRSGGPWSTTAVKGWVLLMQAELVVAGMLVLHQIPRGHDMVAPWALVGFAFVSAARFAHRMASPNVPAAERDLGFFARWGAMLVVGVFGWGELQMLGRGEAGLWFHGTLAAAFAVAAMVGRR